MSEANELTGKGVLIFKDMNGKQLTVCHEGGHLIGFMKRGTSGHTVFGADQTWIGDVPEGVSEQTSEKVFVELMANQVVRLAAKEAMNATA